MGCDVVTVSTDTKFTHLAWREHEKELAKVGYPMGADPAGRLSRMFGVYDEASGLALRGTFIINPAGVLLGSEVNFYNLGRNIDELMRKFKANALPRRQDRPRPAPPSGRRKATRRRRQPTRRQASFRGWAGLRTRNALRAVPSGRRVESCAAWDGRDRREEARSCS